MTHEWTLKTSYYTATIPIWIDEISDLEQWKAEFLKPEAKEVLQAIGAYIYCFSTLKVDGENEVNISPDVEATMQAVSEVVERACGAMWDGIKLAIDLTPANKGKDTAVAEEQCLDLGFEYVHLDATGKNEYGEELGLGRAKEALEANSWSAQSEEDDEEEIGDFGNEEAQMNAELMGMKASLLDPENEGDDEEAGGAAFQIEGMEQMMSQLLAIRGMCEFAEI